jgi:hypothetical protein
MGCALSVVKNGEKGICQKPLQLHSMVVIDKLEELTCVNMYYICTFLFCTLSLSLLGDLV